MLQARMSRTAPGGGSMDRCVRTIRRCKASETMRALEASASLPSRALPARRGTVSFVRAFQLNSGIFLLSVSPAHTLGY
jgi:hypothetical protein